MNILVSGATGFIGKNLIKSNNAYHLIPISLRNVSIENINFSGIDTILHLAALVHQMKRVPDEMYYKINSDLTFEFAKKAKQKGVKHFIFMSTAKVFGENTTLQKPFNENSSCNPLDAYSKSKLQAEERLKTLEEACFIVSIVRIPLVYGAGVKGNLISLINLVGQFQILPFGFINNKRSLVYVENLIDLLYKIIDKKKSGIFIACDNQPLSTTQLLEIIAKSLNKKVILFKMPFILKKLLTKVKPEIIDRIYGSFELNNSQTNSKLEFVPRYSIEKGIKEMIDFQNKNSTQ